MYQGVSCAQDIEALTLSIMKESTKLPSARVLGGPFHPGVEMGYDRFLNGNTNHQFLLSIKLGYYLHENIHQGITIKPALSYYYATNSNIYIGSEINIGYLHAFMDKSLFNRNSDGEYEEIINFGKPKFMPSLAFSSGYQLYSQERNYLNF